MTKEEEEQLLLEKEHISLHREKYLLEYTEARAEGKDLLKFKPESMLLAEYITPLAEKIEDWVKNVPLSPGRNHMAYQLLKEVDPYDAAFIALRALINSLFNRRVEATRIALNIGESIKFNLHYKKFKKEHKGACVYIEDRTSTNKAHKKKVYKANMENRGYDLDSVENVVVVSTGFLLMDFAQEVTAAFSMEHDTSKFSKRVTNKLQATPELISWLDQAHTKSADYGFSSPVCVVKPRDWTSVYDGGYHTTALSSKSPLVRYRFLRRNDVPNNHSHQVYDVVNSVQSIPWTIDPFIYNTLVEIHRLGGGIAGIPVLDKTLNLPGKPWNSDEEYRYYKENDPDVVRAYCKTMHKETTAWCSAASQREMLFQRIEMGKKYLGKNIHFVNFYDWRGRLYYRGNHTPQGDDCAKALLTFANEKEIGTDEGVYWLAVAGANHFGWDKIPFDERVKKVEEHTKTILACARDPLSELFWAEADEPFQFLSFCNAWGILHGCSGQAVAAGNKAFTSSAARSGSSALARRTRFIVRLDGSCNGLQHYSAALLDARAAMGVNVAPSPTPQDIYGEVAKKVSELLQHDLVSDDADKKHLASLWEGQVTRKIVKRPVMTLPYSVTRFGMSEQIYEEVRGGQASIPEGEEMAAAVYLSHKVVEALGSVTTSATEGMAWLKQVADLVVSGGKTLGWTTPVGFQVEQDYREVKVKQVNTFFGGVRIQPQVNIPLENQKRSTNLAGIAPNFIHSMDATHLSLTCLAANGYGIRDLAFVHDSYGTHACDIPVLNRVLRESFVELYSVDRFMEFKENMEVRTGISLPDPPKRGNFDIEDVYRSKYFFA